MVPHRAAVPSDDRTRRARACCRRRTLRTIWQSNDGRPSVVPVADAHFWEFNQSGVLFAPPNPTGFPNRFFITLDGLPYGNGGIPAQFNAAGTALTGLQPGHLPEPAVRRIPFSSGGDGFNYQRSDGALQWRRERTAANSVGYDLDRQHSSVD